MKKVTYQTRGTTTVFRSSSKIDTDSALRGLLRQIDIHRGVIFASSYEDPGRYARYSLGFVNPPIELVAKGRIFTFSALNKRGEVILKMIYQAILNHTDLLTLNFSGSKISGEVKNEARVSSEEGCLRQPTIFSVVRAVQEYFYSPQEPHLGFYGAVGYDVAFQFDPLAEKILDRPDDQNDLHLYFPDKIIVVDHRKEEAYCHSYEFSLGEQSTIWLRRSGKATTFRPGITTDVVCDHEDGEYAEKVRQIIEGARNGDHFEVVLSQTLSTGFVGTPSSLFEAMRKRNFSPYEFCINFGDEQLVGSSPEMFVRVEGKRVETCPISGTIKRGRNAVEDAEQVLELLNSKKDASELTMCTDVDRNDKSRVCKPGSVKIVEARLIEKYQYLIHTADHVEGELRDDCDGLDALASHMWACTLTGAPKPTARQTIERLEKSARGWYGGSVGMFRFNGDINTGITIRTAHLKDGVAHVRAGSTILFDSVPEDEEKETRLKASGMINTALSLGKSFTPVFPKKLFILTGVGKKVLLVNNDDSFVHTLGSYFEQTGASVVTYRAPLDYKVLDEVKPDIVVISPGPGRPGEFGVPDFVEECVRRGIPVFGVCLGLQGIVEHFGGTLKTLTKPMHGKSSVIFSEQKGILDGLPKEFEAGRYHSLYAEAETLPKCLEVIAHTNDGVIMAIQHVTLPITAVQFHPESMMTLRDDIGLRIIANVMKTLT